MVWFITMEQGNRNKNQRDETDALRQEISELRGRLVDSYRVVEREEYSESSIGRTLGTIGTRFKSLLNNKKI
jgi:hypothetical protein